MRSSLRKILITSTLLFAVLFSYSQDKGDFRLNVGGSVLTVRDKIFYSPGIDGEYFLSDKWALNYSLGYGQSNEGDIAFHFPLAWLAVPFACDPEAIIFCAMVPEGVSYHFYPKENLEVSPFINALQAQCILGEEEMLNVNWGAGVKVYYIPVERVSVCFQYGLSMPYIRPEAFFNAGVSIGVLF